VSEWLWVLLIEQNDQGPGTKQVVGRELRRDKVQV
jgi:hypothetical protein